MGVSVRDLLNAEAFKNFELVAGHGGLDNHIQGIAVMDAPDAFQWAQGRELLITTGYVFYKNPDLLKQIVESGDLQKISAFAIKLKRYIHEIPEDVKAIFDEYNIPLISIPFEYSWMNIMNQLNVHVMNQNIRQFNIRNMNLNNYSDRSYQVRKIHKILSAIEKEMKFPAMLYDITNKKAYYSSPSFSKQTDHLRIEDFWDPSFNVQKVTLCNNLNMTRFRSFDQKFDKPYSWITVPISVDNKILAYFVVVEATGLIDFFDQFALRIGFILLQSLFEQMLIVQTLGDQQFEKFISDCLSGNLFDLDKIEKRANNLQIDINQEFYYALIKQTNNDSQFSNYKGIVKILSKRIFMIQMCKLLWLMKII